MNFKVESKKLKVCYWLLATGLMTFSYSLLTSLNYLPTQLFYPDLFPNRTLLIFADILFDASFSSP